MYCPLNELFVLTPYAVYVILLFEEVIVTWAQKNELERSEKTI